jgi:sec-independent protein translocase protein TatA
MNFGKNEILVVLLIVILIFGAKRIPELARALGRGIGEFKSGMKEQPPPPESKKPEEPPKP